MNMKKMIEFVADGLVFNKFKTLLGKAGLLGAIQLHRFYLKLPSEMAEKTRIRIVCESTEVHNFLAMLNSLICNCGGVCETYSIVVYDTNAQPIKISKK